MIMLLTSFLCACTASSTRLLLASSASLSVIMSSATSARAIVSSALLFLPILDIAATTAPMILGIARAIDFRIFSFLPVLSSIRLKRVSPLALSGSPSLSDS